MISQTGQRVDCARLEELRDGLFFVVGNHRGGTTLLQSMLTSHSVLSIPPETGFFEEIWTRQAQFGDLQTERGLQRVLACLTDPRFSISDLELPAADVAATFRETDRRYEDLFVVLMSLYAESRGKRRAGEKSPHHIFYVPTMAQLFPHARFITLLRDPRAVVNSELQTTWGSRSVGRITKRWNQVVDQHQRLSRLLPAERYTLVQYETFVAEPERELRRLDHFLNIPFEPEQLEFFNRDSSELGFRSSENWKHNTLRPLTTDRASAWQSQLSPERIALIERRAGSRLTELGYLAAGGEKTSRLATIVQAVKDRSRWSCEVLTALLRPRERRRPWRNALADALRCGTDPR